MTKEKSCHFHEQKSASGQCAICHLYLCEGCLYMPHDIALCKTHQSIDQSKFIPLHSVLSTSDDATLGVALYETKLELWNSYQMVLVIEVSYEIDEAGRPQTRSTLFGEADNKKATLETFNKLLRSLSK